MDELMNRGLPKWPQMVVTGEAVSEAQALEIIRRTDTFFCSSGYAGNDRDHCRRLMKLFGYPEEPEQVFKATSEEMKAHWAECRGVWDRQDAWRKAWGHITTEYVHNSWIACAYIGGPHGWCHPDGSIGFGDSVGKWPSVEAVMADWNTLTAAFPFLDLGVTLMDRESCEENPQPVVSLVVRGGEVRLVDPAAEDVHAGRTRPAGSPDLTESVLALAYGYRRECGLPESVFQRWAAERVGP